MCFGGWQELLKAGMCVARFDFSWNDADYHSETLANLREAMQRTSKLCATMLDTQGPEIAIIRQSKGNEFYDEGSAPPIRLSGAPPARGQVEELSLSGRECISQAPCAFLH
jgi:pyruvate kinase